MVLRTILQEMASVLLGLAKRHVASGRAPLWSSSWLLRRFCCCGGLISCVN